MNGIFRVQHWGQNKALGSKALGSELQGNGGQSFQARQWGSELQGNAMGVRASLAISNNGGHNGGQSFISH